MNPFTKLQQANVSKPAPERPTAPLMERYAGTNIPYRGIQQHGVDAEVEYPDMPDFSDESEEYADYPTEVPPVPVIVVNESAEEHKRFRVMNFKTPGLNGDPGTFDNVRAIQVLGRDMNRTSVTITYHGTANGGSGYTDAYFSHEPFVVANSSGGGRPSNAFELGARAPITLHTTEPVYIACVWESISVIVEYASL